MGLCSVLCRYFIGGSKGARYGVGIVLLWGFWILGSRFCASGQMC